MERLHEAIKASLTPDLLKKGYEGGSHPMSGHCYVASEVLFHTSPLRYRPMNVRVNGVSHWFLIDQVDNSVVDLTFEQFDDRVPYEAARGKGFLTKRPSKRAQVVLERIGYDVRTW